MGRKKKDLTPEDIQRREKSANRVKALKIQMGISYKELADRLDLSEATIRNYVHMRSAMDIKVAQLFQELTGTIWLYWLGDTDCKSWTEYEAEIDMLQSEAAENFIKDWQKRIDQYDSFFSICGFQYTDLDSIPENEFNPEIIGQHRISDTETGITVTLSDSELQSLIDRLRSTIQLECFIKSKQA